jgi:hypothetical protein
VIDLRHDTSGPVSHPRAFFVNGRRDTFLVVVFLLINAIVAYNAVLHDPWIGYDAENHLSYIRALSDFHLVSPSESYEFFSPPLPYLIPACLLAWTSLDLFAVAKAGQLVNVLLSLGVTYFLLRICDTIVPEARIKQGALVCLGIFPVYYKTFAFVRGEPYVVFFTMLVLYFALGLPADGRLKPGRLAWLGIFLGLLALSRQWGILVIAGVIFFWAVMAMLYPEWRLSLWTGLLACVIIALCISAWFYVALHQRHGRATAFNRDPERGFSLANQPREFYFSVGVSQLFTRPVRRAFPNQLMPLFYSDLWGDYWGYFNLYGKDKRSGKYVSGGNLALAVIRDKSPVWLETNWETMASYLGRVNLISLPASFLAMAAVLFGFRSVRTLWVCRRARPPSTLALSALFVLTGILFSFGGYFWFLIMYPNPVKGDTINATYMIQTLPMIAILVGCFLEWLSARYRRWHVVAWLALLLPFFHNFPVFFTRYPV